ncbi:MAG: DUF3786 domain-containing protein [Phycisphaerae bacterium]|nr:DUF3786 domain-containing protein [Phycisphaerae bacterium]
MALERVGAQSADQLEWLGARRDADSWALGVLDDLLTVELTDGTVRTSGGEVVGGWWQILTLHYLGVSDRPQDQPPGVTFADLAGARAYGPVYHQRVIERVCRTIGRDRDSLLMGGESLGAKVAPVGDLGLDFRVYPRVGVRLIWYAGDEEFGPSASLLLPENIESFFCLEDVVVLSERLISRVSGGSF